MIKRNKSRYLPQKYPKRTYHLTFTQHFSSVSWLKNVDSKGIYIKILKVLKISDCPVNLENAEVFINSQKKKKITH